MEFYLELLGYIASLVVLVSLIMSSIKKLRWINLIGAALFAGYGFFIGSIPTGIMNIGIVFINTYYLVQIYTAKDYFTYLIVSRESRYLRKIFKTQREEIDKYFPDFKYEKLTDDHISFISLRNLNAAGALILLPNGKDLEVKLDFALKQYRDFKTTVFIIERESENLKNVGYKRVTIETDNKSHMKYLSKINFKKIDGLNKYEYKL